MSQEAQDPGTASYSPVRPAAGRTLLERYERTPLGALHRWLGTPPPDLKPEYADFYALSNTTHAMGLLAHVLFLGLFISLGLWSMVVVGGISVAVFITTLWWSKTGKVDLALLVGGLAVCTHQGLAVLTLGLEPAFQHYILILAVGTLFYRHIRLQTRIAMAILPIVDYVVVTLVGLHHQPWYLLTPVVRDSLAAMNVVSFIVVLMGICIYFQHSVEQARVLAEKMARSKTLFLANMSHELRTPLNAILGFAQILRRSSGLSEQDRRNLATIDRSGEHLLELINDILDMSKLEEGKLALQRSACDLHRLLDDVHAMFTIAARDKQLALAVERAPEVPRWVEADELRLRQVLINLLGKAVKFTARGVVRLTVGRASAGRAADATLHLRRRPPARALGRPPPAGQPGDARFQRRQPPGGGHRGRRPGRRRQPRPDLDRRVAHAYEPPRNPLRMSNIPEGAAMTPQKILLIDDDPSVTRLLKAKLESLGITTEATNEPDQAPGLVRRFKPDLIVCDIDMGDAAGGGEVAQELDGDWRTAGIPIVFLSSMVMPEDMGHKQGGRKLISKQISMAAILERIVAELPPRK